MPALNATAALPYCALLHWKAARSSDASTENTCRSSRLIMIDADSSPTIVHRCEDEMPTSAPTSADTAGRGAALTVLGGVIEQLSLDVRRRRCRSTAAFSRTAGG